MRSPAAEFELGMEFFLTDHPGIGGRLRAACEDFVVEEIPAELPESPSGPHTALILRARNWETHRLGVVLGTVLHVGPDRVRFGGTKDKRAVSTQQATVPLRPDRLPPIPLKDIEVLSAKGVSRPIRMGELLGNRFDITVRDVAASPDDAREKIGAIAGDLAARGGFLNYFGPQRFGAMRPVTHQVGRAIVTGDLERAVMLFAANPLPDDSPQDAECRRSLQEGRDFARWAKEMPPHLGFERSMCAHLAERPDDFVGALERLPRALTLMFVHSYQSYIFNRILSGRLGSGLAPNEPVEGDLVAPLDRAGAADIGQMVEVKPSNLARVAEQMKRGRAAATAPLFGTDTVLAGGRAGELERKVLAEEGVDAKTFVVGRMPYLSTKGTRRAILVAPLGLQTGVGDGWANFKFTLPPGCYATCLLREFMKSDDIKSY